MVGRLQNLAKCATRLAIAVALVAVGATPVLAAESGTMSEAGPIRDECALAEEAIRAAKALVRSSTMDEFLDTARTSQQHVIRAYDLSLSAPWPTTLRKTRSGVEVALATTLKKLSSVVSPDARMPRPRVRSMLGRERSRMERTAVVLGRVAAAGNPPPPPGKVPRLTPGTGFPGATAQPPQVGTGTAATQKAMAHWDVVPHQTITAEFVVGVVAFHVNGIERVDLAVQGGTWKSSTSMTRNAQTGADEYCARLDPADFPEGEIELRAIAYPVRGVPRVLEPLLLYVKKGSRQDPRVWVDATNGDDSTAAVDDSTKPARTITRAANLIVAANGAADGGTILLRAGNHRYGVDPSTSERVPVRTRWLTITRAPGVARSSVAINEGGTLGADLVRLDDVTLKTVNQDQSYLIASDLSSSSVWVSNCDVAGAGWLVNNDIAAGFTKTFFTDVGIKDVQNGVNAQIARNVSITNVTGDAFSGSKLVVNCTVANADARVGEVHADIFQFYAGGEVMENHILYGLVAKDRIWSQGIFGWNATKDVAIVNCDVDNQSLEPLAAAVFGFADPTVHMYVKGSRFVGNSVWYNYPGSSYTDIVVEGCTFLNGDGSPYNGNRIDPADQSGVTYR